MLGFNVLFFGSLSIFESFWRATHQGVLAYISAIFWTDV